MYASAQRYHEYAFQFRWLARASAVILFVGWIGFVVAEILRPNYPAFASDTFLQAGILAVVFAGYAIAWRKELIGGLMAVLGTVAFLVALTITMALPGDLSVAWFAVPGVLFLLARHYDRRSLEPPT